MPLFLLLASACSPTIAQSGSGTTTAPGWITATTPSSSDTTTPTTPFGLQVAPHPEVACMLQVDWRPDPAAHTSWIEYRFEDQDWWSSPAQTASGKPLSTVLLGTPGDTGVELRIVQQIDDQTQTSDSWTATTGSIPSSLPEALVTIWDPTLASSDRWLLGSIDVDLDGWYGGPFWVFILDREGRVVWYHPVPDKRLALQAQVAWAGSHIVFEGSVNYVWDDSVQPTVTTLALDHSHHEIRELANLGLTLDEIEGGRILYEQNADTRNLVELSPDGTQREIWRCNDWLETVGGSDSACAPNTIIWVPETDTVLWSMYNNDTVVEIDRQTGDLLRQWGQARGSWSVDPPGAMIDYQHYPNYTEDGTLLVSTHVLGQANSQMAREFLVDDENQTLVEIWHYGEDTDHYARYAGEATRHEDNTLISYGTGGAVAEVTPAGELAWEVLWQSGEHDHLIGHLSLIDDLYALTAGPAAR